MQTAVSFYDHYDEFPSVQAGVNSGGQTNWATLAIRNGRDDVMVTVFTPTTEQARDWLARVRAAADAAIARYDAGKNAAHLAPVDTAVA